MQIQAINPRASAPQQIRTLHDDLQLLNQMLNTGKTDAGTFNGQPASFYAPAKHKVDLFHIPMALTDTKWVDSGISIDPTTGEIHAPGLSIPAAIDNIDGGSAEAVYLVQQVIDGGAAEAIYLGDQVLNGGGA